MFGSHFDTVRDAGKYDGPLGVMIALACVERLHQRNERLPFALEVVGFSDEEGLRFGTTFLGSSVFAGTFDPRLLNLEDADGVKLSDLTWAAPSAGTSCGRSCEGRQCSATVRSSRSRSAGSSDPNGERLKCRAPERSPWLRKGA